MRKEMSNFNDVKTFMNAFGQEVKVKAEFPNEKIVELRYELIQEELNELKKAMEDKNLDYVVIGEGEYVFKELVGFYSGVCELPKRGICFRNSKTGELENRGHSEFIKDLNTLPKPAYHLIDFLSYYNNY